MLVSLSQLFERDLLRLKDELDSYTEVALIWKTVDGISNSAGNLTLHVCGNLQYFVGGVLGNSGYVRQRDREFSAKDVPITELHSELKTTSEVVRDTFESLDTSTLRNRYPVNVFGTEMTTEWFLLHLSGHLNYHLGQVNYHRRILDIKPTV